MAIRDIRIPEIGFKDNYTGWSDGGFVPVQHNAELNRWRVELIEYTHHGVHVARLPLSATMKGSVMIDPAKKGLTKVVAVVFSDAPKTTASAPFTLTARR